MILAAALVVLLVGVFGPSGAGSYGRDSSGVAAYLLAQRHDLGAPGMAVGVVEGGKAQDSAAGVGSPAQPFVIGSVTKPITALAVMQLVEAGRVRLDNPVVTYLPEFRTRNRSRSEEITVRELLTQTSGLSTTAGETPFSDPATTLLGQVRALGRVTASTPGVFRYSNANYEVLGALVERVSGQGYGAYLHEHVLAPLRMSHTYTDLPAARAAGLRAGHKIWFGVPFPNGTYYRADFLPAGMVVSTAGDLDHFAMAMLNGGRYGGRSVLSDAGVHALVAPSVDASAPRRPRHYGMGWYREDIGGRTLVYAPGSAHNGHGSLVLVPDENVAVTLLADAESTLYYLVPKFDLVALNGAVLASGGTAQGTLRGLYIVFDLLATAALVLYLRSLTRVLRRRTPWFAGLRPFGVVTAVWREVVVPPVLLTLLPAHLALTWPVLIHSDVGLLAATVSVLGLVTLVLRAGFALRARRSTPGGAEAPEEASAGPPPTVSARAEPVGTT